MSSLREVAAKAAVIDLPLTVRRLAQEYWFKPPLSLRAIIHNIEAPEELRFGDVITTPAGTSLGGRVEMLLRSDGSYRVEFHMHDSGAPGYDFQIRAIFTTKTVLVLVAEHNSHVAGTFTSGDRDDDYLQQGTNASIRLHWPDISQGKLHLVKDYSATGVIGFVQDVAQIVLDVGATAVGGAIGLVITLGSTAGQFFGHMGFAGTLALIGGVAVFAITGGVVLAVVVGVAVGAMTNAVIEQRPINDDEMHFAQKVFGSALPRSKIMITNLFTIGHHKFVAPGIDDKIYVNMGEAWDCTTTYVNERYPYPGQTFIHELTHVWQAAHSAFQPAFVCRGVVQQADKLAGHNVYEYGPPGRLWSTFNTEQQASIVDQWFAGIPNDFAPDRVAPMDENDPYFAYIRDNVRAAVV